MRLFNPILAIVIYLMWVFFKILYSRKLSTTILNCGAIEMPVILKEARLGLTHKKPKCRAIGTHPSPRSVLEWRLPNRSTSLSSTSRPTLCTHWSLMVNIVLPRWVVKLGRRWLVHRPPYSPTVTRKGLTLVATKAVLKQELELLVIRKKTVIVVIPELGLALEDSLWTPTLVEMWPNTAQIMETKISKPWVTSWCSERKTDIVAWEYLRNIGVLLKDWKTAVEWKTKIIKNGVGNSCALKNTYQFSIWWTVHVYYSWGAVCKKIIYNKFVTFFAYLEIIKTTSKNCL